MKKYILSAAIFAAATLCGTTASAQERGGQNDSITNAVRIKSLQEKRQTLKAQIDSEDKKRNQRIEGVSAANLELINDKQDSVCLELRSQLVAVELELQEISPNQFPAQVVQQFSTLMQQQPAATTGRKEE